MSCWDEGTLNPCLTTTCEHRASATISLLSRLHFALAPIAHLGSHVTAESPKETGRRAEARGEYHAAREYYERAMQELDQDAPPPAVAALLLQIARTFVATGRLSEATDCIEAVFALPDDGEMDLVLAESHELRGRLLCEAGGLEAAEADFTQQRQRATAANNKWLEALAHEHLASVALIQGRWHEGIDALEVAANAYRENAFSADAVRVLLQLATLNLDLKRWNAAEHALGEAQPQAQKLGQQQTLARLELVRAHMAIDRGNSERARASAERALEIARRSEDAALAAECVALAGIVARESGDGDRALGLFDDAERQATALDDAMLLGELASERAEVLARRNDHRVTLRALNRAYRALAKLLGQTGSVDHARRLRRLESTFLDVTRRWAQRFEAVDHDTIGHVDRVADLTVEMARRLGVDPSALFGYRVGAYLHDLGKLAIPAAILNKRGRLSAEEWAAVKRHPVAGAEMLMEADFPWEVRPIVESHHECWDGSGYPHGRAGHEIPLAARIFCAADVYDALVTRRPFKEALPQNEAVDVMRRDVGRQFDPAVFRVFEDVIRDGVPIPGVTSAAAVPKPSAAPVLLVDDALTGVADFSSWAAHAANVLAEGRRSASDGAVVLLNLDEFSRVNSAYGRLQGDDVLWAVAKVLQRGVRSGDVVGRRGGDEFVVLLPATDTALAAEIGERLREGVSRLRCAQREAPDESLVVTVSVAIAVCPADGENVETLLAAADRAMFRAKREGRDRVVSADRSEPARAQKGLDFSTFVGREDELRTVVGQLDAAGHGDPRVVSIVGEVGIGKSALVRQVEPEARLRDGWIATGRAWTDGRGGPFAPWADVVRHLVEVGGPGDRAWRALPQLVPELSPLDPSDLEPPTSILQQEIVAFVRRHAREHLVVVCLEDMHLAAPAAWATLDALLTSIDNERLLVVYTMRPEVQPGVAEWRRRVQQHDRVTPLTLRRFDLDEVRSWIRAVFHDAAPGDEVPRWVFEFSEGIPAFAAHLLRSGCEDGTIWYGGTRWEWRPPEVNAVGSGIAWVLDRRLERLSENARRVMAAAAVLQSGVTVELLAAVTGVAESLVRAALHEGVSASVLTVVGDASDEQFAFRHAQLAEASVRGLPERQRQQVHELAARVLELRAPSAVEAIAAHYHAAGDDEAALAYATLSAERSLGIGTHDAALGAFQVAQRYATSARALATVRVRQGEVALEAGRYAQAESLGDLAIEWLDRQSVDGLVIRGRRLRDWVRFRRGRGGARAVESLRQQVEDATAHAPEELATSALRAAESAIDRAEWGTAAQFARRALGATAETVAARAALALAWAEDAQGVASDLEALRQSVQRFVALSDAQGEAMARNAFGLAAWRRKADSDESEASLIAGLEKARAAHHAGMAAHLSRSLGLVRTHQGQFDEAMHWLGDAERLQATIGDEVERTITWLATGAALRAQGDRPLAEQQFDVVAKRGQDMGIVWLELAGHAAAALCNGGAESITTQKRWARATELVAGTSSDWWFSGREFVDALAVKMALAGGHTSVAHDLFSRSLGWLQRVDLYASTWLASECTPDLVRAGLPAVADARREALSSAREFGFKALADRLA